MFDDDSSLEKEFISASGLHLRIVIKFSELGDSCFHFLVTYILLE